MCCCVTAARSDYVLRPPGATRGTIDNLSLGSMEDAPGQNVCHKGRRQRNENEADGDGFLLRPINFRPGRHSQLKGWPQSPFEKGYVESQSLRTPRYHSARTAASTQQLPRLQYHSIAVLGLHDRRLILYHLLDNIQLCPAIVYLVTSTTSSEYGRHQGMTVTVVSGSLLTGSITLNLFFVC